MASSMIEEWLKLLNLDQYAEAFFDNGYDDLEIAKQISNPDLDAIGVKRSEHRERILKAVKTLQEEGVSSLYFTLEPASDLERESSDEDASSCLETGKISIPKLKLKMMIRNKLILDSVNLCDSPYSNPDGSLGNIESLATVYSAEYSTYYRDVEDCIEELRRRKLAKDMGQIHTAPVEYGSSSQQVLHSESAGIQGDLGEPLLATFTKSRFGGSRSHEINSDSTLSDGEGKKRTRTINKIFKKGMYFKGKDKIVKDRGKSASRIAVNEIIASEITMSDEERIQLMMQVKEGNMTVDQVLEKVKKYEAEKKKMKEREDLQTNSNSADELDDFVVKSSSRLKVRMPSIRKKKKIHKDEDHKQLTSYSNYEKLGSDPVESVDQKNEEMAVAGVTVSQEECVHQNGSQAPAEIVLAYHESQVTQQAAVQKPQDVDLKQNLGDDALNYCVVLPDEAGQAKEYQPEDRASPPPNTPLDNSQTASQEAGTTKEKEQQPLMQEAGKEAVESDSCNVSDTATDASPIKPIAQAQSLPPLPQTTDEAVEVVEADVEHCQCSLNTTTLDSEKKEKGKNSLPNEIVEKKEEQKQVAIENPEEETEVQKEEEEEVTECQEITEFSKSPPSFFDKVKKISRKLSVSSRSQSFSHSSNNEGLIPTSDQHTEVTEDGKSNVYGSCESLRSSASGNSQQSNQGSLQSQTNSSSSNRESTASQEDEAPTYTGPFCGKAKVHSDFIPSPYDTDSLKLKKGDIVQVISKPPMGTWIGLLNNKVGTFKFIYVDLLSDQEEDSSNTNKPKRKKGKSKITPKVNNVEALLRKIGLEEYISVFSLNGYDTLDLFRNIEDEDLQELHITNAEHKIKLLTAAELLHDSEESEDEDIRKNGDVGEGGVAGITPSEAGLASLQHTRTFQAELCEKLSVVSPRDSGCYASNENLPKDSGSSTSGSGSASSSGSGNGTIARQGSSQVNDTCTAIAVVDEVRGVKKNLMEDILENLAIPIPSTDSKPPLVRPRSSEELFTDIKLKQNFCLKRDYFEAKQGHKFSQSLSGLRKHDGSGSSSFHELVNLYEQTASEVDKAHKPPKPMPRNNFNANKKHMFGQEKQHQTLSVSTTVNNSCSVVETSAEPSVSPATASPLSSTAGLSHPNPHHQSPINLSVNLPKRHRPKSQSLSLEDLIKRKLQDEQIDLTLKPYTTDAGHNGVPLALIERYSEELKSEIQDVAVAMDSQRVDKLAENDAERVALKFADLDTRLAGMGRAREAALSVEEWLTSLGLPMYTGALVSKGWDEVEFLGLISEEDLKSCGVNNPNHLRKLLLAVKRLKSI